MPFKTTALLLLIGLSSTALWAKTWRINLRDANFNAFVSEVADITGKNFVVDPQLGGRLVTVISNRDLQKAEVYQLFLSVLSVNGISAIPENNVIRLVQDSNVRQAGTTSHRDPGNKSQFITRVLDVSTGNATELIAAVKPLLSNNAHIAAINGDQMIIINDRAANIEQLNSLMKSVASQPGMQDVEFIKLQHASPEEMLESINALLGTAGATAGSAPAAGAKPSMGGVSVLTEPRSKRLILKGNIYARANIKKLITQLDVPADTSNSGVRIFKLKNARAKDIATALQNLVGNSNTVVTGANSTAASGSTAPNSGNNATGSSNSNNSVIADESLNAIIVKAKPSVVKEIEGIIEQLDTRRRQVLIQAAIVEVSGSISQQLGVQWALGDPKSGIGTISYDANNTTIASTLANYNALVNGGTLGPGLVTAPGAAYAFADAKFNGSNIRSFWGGFVQALATDNNSNLLSAPYITTLDNQEASLLVGENIPVVSGQTTTGTTNGTTTSFSRQDIGISLKVTPRIGESGTIALDVEQEVSDVISNNVRFSAARDIVTSKRKITTTVLADNQQIVVLGGLMKDNKTTNFNRIPGLSDLPLIKHLFRAKTRESSKNNLLVFLQPTVLESADDANKIAEQKYKTIQQLELDVNTYGNIQKRLPDTLQEVLQMRFADEESKDTSKIEAPKK